MFIEYPLVFLAGKLFFGTVIALWILSNIFQNFPHQQTIIQNNSHVVL